MPRAKSQAEIFAARLNPINEREKEAIRIIKDCQKRGVNFKELVVDRLLRMEGIVIESRNDSSSRIIHVLEHKLMNHLEELLIEFGESLLSQLRQGQWDGTVNQEQDSEFTSEFTNNFLSSLTSRNQDDQK